MALRYAEQAGVDMGVGGSRSGLGSAVGPGRARGGIGSASSQRWDRQVHERGEQLRVLARDRDWERGGTTEDDVVEELEYEYEDEDMVRDTHPSGIRVPDWRPTASAATTATANATTNTNTTTNNTTTGATGGVRVGTRVAAASLFGPEEVQTVVDILSISTTHAEELLTQFRGNVGAAIHAAIG